VLKRVFYGWDGMPFILPNQLRQSTLIDTFIQATVCSACHPTNSVNMLKP